MHSSAPQAVVAIDVGGTELKGAVFDAANAVIDARSVPTAPDRGPQAVVDDVRRLAVDLVARSGVHHHLVAAGIVAPGTVDSVSGIARSATNIGWHDVPLRQILHRELDIPIAVGHDVRAAGLAEAQLGAGADSSNFAFVAIGTGIAVAIVLDGVAQVGAHGLAGELGHIPVFPYGEECSCGRRGCLETYASGAAIARHYAASTGITRSAAEIVCRLDHDPAAAATWRRATQALAIGLATYASLLDPELIVIGGGLSQAGDKLRDAVRATLSANLVWNAPPIVISSLGPHAGRLGAALLAWSAASSA